MSPRLSFTPPPPSQDGKREWHPERQGTAERKAPVSCLPGSKGPGVEKGGIFRSNLTPPTCPSTTLSWWLQLLQAGHSKKRVNGNLALRCCQIGEWPCPREIPWHDHPRPRPVTPDLAGHSVGTHHTQECPFLGITRGTGKSAWGWGGSQPPTPRYTASSPPGQ